jgi:hypothetical protein
LHAVADEILDRDAEAPTRHLDEAGVAACGVGIEVIAFERRLDDFENWLGVLPRSG